MQRQLLLLPLLGLITLAGCVNREAQKVAQDAAIQASDRSKAVETAKPSRFPLTETLTVSGALATVQEVTLAAERDGRLAWVGVREGDTVQAGQVIARLDTDVLQAQERQAVARTRAAQAQYRQAARNAERARARAQAQLHATEREADVARAELRRVQAGARQEEIAQAEAELRAALAGQDIARKELVRAEFLEREGATSRQALELAQNQQRQAREQAIRAEEALRLLKRGARQEEIDAAQARVRQADAQVEAARAALKQEETLRDQADAAQEEARATREALAETRTTLRQTAIRAPFSGRIYGRPLEKGTAVGFGDAIARLVRDGALQFEADVPQEEVARVRPGQSTQVQLTGSRTGSIAGRVLSISPKGERTGRLFRVLIALDRLPADWRPGMFGQAQLVLRRSRGLVIPRTALVLQEGRNIVFVVRSGRAIAIPVQIGVAQGNRVAVSGLPANAEVVIRGQQELTDGDSVVSNARIAQENPR